MADVSVIRTAIKTRLVTIASLNVYDQWPDTINAPGAIVNPVSMAYHQTMGATGFKNELAFEVVLLAAALQQGFTKAQLALDNYIDDTGASSIRAAIAGDKTLGGNVATLLVPGWRNYGPVEVNGIEYLGVVFDLRVWP